MDLIAAHETLDSARAVLNQPPPLAPINFFEVDAALRESLEREGGGWGLDRARETGRGGGEPGDGRALPARRTQPSDSADP